MFSVKLFDPTTIGLLELDELPAELVELLPGGCSPQALSMASNTMLVRNNTVNFLVIFLLPLH